MAVEIERKYLMEGFPKDLECLEELTMSQGYLSIEPEIRIHTARNNRTGEQDYRLTVKGNGTLSRTEIKTDLEEEFYLEAVKLLGLPMIQKQYKAYRLDQGILEVCLVDPGTGDAFYYGEVEFDSEEAAMEFRKPDCLGEEVTDNPNYKMKNYWKRTRMERNG